jgi:uncharacterized protein (DUF58 family)
VIRGRALAAVRTPARPGPGPMPDALLRALDFDVRRRIDGQLAGDYQAASLGLGTELAQVRRYEPGDDVRQIEWNVTARTGEPHVRVQIAEKALTTWILLDASASMAFGTADRRKADVAEGVSLALGHVATRRGNRVGTVVVGGPTFRSMRPTQGRLGMLGLLAQLRREPEVERAGAGSLHDALRGSAALVRGQSAVFVVSDFRGPSDWSGSLGRLCFRHEVTAVEICDPREHELSDVGDIWLMDPETGRQLRADTGSATVRARFAHAAAAERDETRRAIRAAGARHIELSTSGDWLRALAAFLAGGRAVR